jgi:hypothetical protein
MMSCQAPARQRREGRCRRRLELRRVEAVEADHAFPDPHAEAEVDVTRAGVAVVDGEDMGTIFVDD